jgi:hypothetical protein
VSGRYHSKHHSEGIGTGESIMIIVLTLIVFGCLFIAAPDLVKSLPYLVKGMVAIYRAAWFGR